MPIELKHKIYLIVKDCNIERKEKKILQNPLIVFASVLFVKESKLKTNYGRSEIIQRK